MVNTVKTTNSSLALQITHAARKANLVDESDHPDGEGKIVERYAPLRMYAFENFIVVVDTERVCDKNIVELVTTVAKRTGTIYQASNTKVQRRGNGYQIPVTVGKDAGWVEGNKIGTYPAPGVLGLGRGSDPDDNGENEAQENTSVPSSVAAETVKIGETLVEDRKAQLADYE